MNELQYIKELCVAFKAEKEEVITLLNDGQIMVFDNKSLHEWYFDVCSNPVEIFRMMHDDIKDNTLVAVGNHWFMWY